MKNSIKTIAMISALVTVFGCGGSDDGGGPAPNAPQAASLIFPVNQEACNTGVIISETESTVTFEWNASASTDNYTVALTNISTGTSQTFPTQQTELAITILRGTPYSWKVFSTNASTTVPAQSETWTFFNAGPGIENYAPFPAELVSPPMGLTLDASTVDLIWKGSDVDGDIDSYDVFMDTANPPVTLLDTKNEPEMREVALQPATTYYWQIVTKDFHNNATKSAVFEFKTQ